MKLKMCAVRDITAQFYFPPFFMRSFVEAERAFEQLLKDPNRSGATSEYSLDYIAEFDDQTGELTPSPNIQQITHGANFKPT